MLSLLKRGDGYSPDAAAGLPEKGQGIVSSPQTSAGRLPSATFASGGFGHYWARPCMPNGHAWPGSL